MSTQVSGLSQMPSRLVSRHQQRDRTLLHRPCSDSMMHANRGCNTITRPIDRLMHREHMRGSVKEGCTLQQVFQSFGSQETLFSICAYTSVLLRSVAKSSQVAHLAFSTSDERLSAASGVAFAQTGHTDEYVQNLSLSKSRVVAFVW